MDGWVGSTHNVNRFECFETIDSASHSALELLRIPSTQRVTEPIHNQYSHPGASFHLLYTRIFIDSPTPLRLVSSSVVTQSNTNVSFIISGRVLLLRGGVPAARDYESFGLGVKVGPF